jgi:hypothetical protein
MVASGHFTLQGSGSHSCSGSTFFHPGSDAGECRLQCRTVIAAALRHVGPATALAADLSRDLTQQVARLDASERAPADAGNECRFSILHAREYYNGINQLLL